MPGMGKCLGSGLKYFFFASPRGAVLSYKQSIYFFKSAGTGEVGAAARTEDKSLFHLSDPAVGPFATSGEE